MIANASRHPVLPVCSRKWDFRRVLAFAALLFAESTCLAHTQPTNQDGVRRLAELDIPRVQWQSVQRFRMAGVQIHVRPFSSSDKVFQLAESLSEGTDIFSRVLTTRRAVVLSGLLPGWHWLAHIEPSSFGSKGFVSTLATDNLQASAQPSDPVYQWLLPDATLRFHHDAQLGTNRTVQRIYTSPLSADGLSVYLRRQLRSHGWAEERAIALSDGISVWQRDTARMVLQTQSGPADTALYLQHTE